MKGSFAVIFLYIYLLIYNFIEYLLENYEVDDNMGIDFKKLNIFKFLIRKKTVINLII